MKFKIVAVATLALCLSAGSLFAYTTDQVQKLVDAQQGKPIAQAKQALYKDFDKIKAETASTVMYRVSADNSQKCIDITVNFDAAKKVTGSVVTEVNCK